MLDNDSKINDTHKTTPDDHDIDPTAGSSEAVAHQNPQYLGIDTELFELENAERFVGVDGTPLDVQTLISHLRKAAETANKKAQMYCRKNEVLREQLVNNERATYFSTAKSTSLLP